MLKRATQRVVEDETFHIPVEPAATALRTAKFVLDWATDHEEAMASFEQQPQIPTTGRREVM